MDAAAHETPDLVGWVDSLARAHAVRLTAVARQEGLDTEDALDAVQEAFHTLLHMPETHGLDSGGAAALLATLVRNAARNMRRRHFRARPHVEVDDAPLADDAPSVDELLARAEDYAALRCCVTRLGDVQRRVVTLRMLEQLSGEEVAAELGISQNHVAVLLLRAKKELLRCMLG